MLALFKDAITAKSESHNPSDDSEPPGSVQ